MTGRSKIRFIAAIMILITLAFAAVFMVAAYENRNVLVRESKSRLDFACENYESGNAAALPQRFFVAEVYAESVHEVVFGAEDFTAEETDDVVSCAVLKDYEYGSCGDIFYRRAYDGATLKIYAVDAGDIATILNRSLNTLLIILLIADALLFLAVVGVSTKIFSPIKQTILKQRRFISDASHELKTPLAIISANAEVLDDSSPYVKSIKKQVGRMDYLLADMLFLAKIDEGRKETVNEEFCVSEEVTDVMLTFDALCYEKNKRLTSDITPDITYTGDKAGLKRIVNILLDNAVKYSADKGEIRVSLKKSGQRVVLTVKNDGSAVPDEMSDRIFERFFRDDSRAREYGGNGLGLSIAKSIATDNGWNISAESVFGKSMTVTLVL